jgi:hypothetical protein
MEFLDRINKIYGMKRGTRFSRGGGKSAKEEGRLTG